MFDKVKAMVDLSDSAIVSVIHSYWAYIVGALGFIGTIMMTIVGFFFKRELAKIDDLQKNTIKRPEFDRLVSSVKETKETVEEGRREFRDEHNKTRELVTTALIELAKK